MTVQCRAPVWTTSGLQLLNNRQMFKERLKFFNYSIFKKICIKRLSSTPITNTNLLSSLKINFYLLITQGPPIRYFNDEGGGQSDIFYIQKKPTSGFVYPKNSLLFLAYPKKSHTSSKFQPLVIMVSQNTIRVTCRELDQRRSVL